MESLTKFEALNIIESVGRSGQPPEYGLQFFTAGIEPYMEVIKKEYLSSFIKQGGSSFKMVVGVYGGGKTHFLLCIRDLAWKLNYVTVKVDLSATTTPFHKLELVYAAIARNMVPPLAPDELLSNYDKGIEAFLIRWYGQKYSEYQGKNFTEDTWKAEFLREIDHLPGIDSTSFKRAIRAAIQAYMEGRDDDFSSICQWLKGEGFTSFHKKYNILQKIDKTTAFEMIRSLGQFVREIGYSGIVINFDETEQHSSMSTKDRSILLTNLRELIDTTGHSSFKGFLILYSVPDQIFLDGRGATYEALKQRLDTTFEEFNPTGVKIELEKTIPEPIPFMIEVGHMLADVYQIAYDYKFNTKSLSDIIETTARLVFDMRFGDIGYKRLFVQKIVKEFNYLRNKGSTPTKKELE